MSKRTLIYVVAVGACLAVILTGMWLGRADGAAPAQAPAVSLVTGDKYDGCHTQRRGACHKSKRGPRFVHRFQSGRYRHAHGFRPANVFEAPVAARKVAVRRIANMIRAMRAAGSGRIAAQAGTGVRLRARGVWAGMVNDAPCVSSEGVNYPALPDRCRPSNAPKWTRERVGNWLTVTGCTAGFAVSVLTPAGRVLRALGIVSIVGPCLGDAIS